MCKQSERIWNTDKTGLCFTMKPVKVVTSVGKKCVYRQAFGEKHTTTTSAAWLSIPPLLIFKDDRMIDGMKESFLSWSALPIIRKGLDQHSYFSWMAWSFPWWHSSSKTCHIVYGFTQKSFVLRCSSKGSRQRYPLGNVSLT